jgi:lysozyme
MNLDEATLQSFRWLLIKDEGMKLRPYQDTEGKLTIGAGRNLEDVGISESEALLMLENDIMRVSMEVDRAFSWFEGLNGPRKIVVMSMAFNMGINGLKKFTNMIRSIEQKNYSVAAQEMLKSKWSKQVKKRANALALIMETGEL